ncbi:STAS domain-containing protein [Candidatus Berkelbacteria bacterium]|nr:STAS domain-containing protein [Candidatus Berkelbacteria bacterium]
MNNNPKERAAFSRSKIGGEVPIVVAEIIDGCLYSGFYGTLDSARVQAIIEKILDLLVTTEASYIIVDLSNIDVIDSSVATRLVQISDSVKAIGSEVVFSGISPVIAQTLVGAGVNVKQLQISRNLKSALERVLTLMGKESVVQSLRGKGENISS